MLCFTLAFSLFQFNLDGEMERMEIEDLGMYIIYIEDLGMYIIYIEDLGMCIIYLKDLGMCIIYRLLTT